MPMPVMCAWWLACDVPFHFNTQYKAYLPDLQPEAQYAATYSWMEALVGKIKADLLAIDLWDRQCRGSIWSGSKREE